MQSLWYFPRVALIENQRKRQHCFQNKTLNNHWQPTFLRLLLLIARNKRKTFIPIPRVSPSQLKFLIRLRCKQCFRREWSAWRYFVAINSYIRRWKMSPSFVFLETKEWEKNGKISSSSYEFEEKKWLVDLSGTIKDLNNNQSANAVAMQVEFVYPDNLFEDTVFDNSERNLIFHIGGYVMRSVAKNYTVCEACYSPLLSKSPFLRSFTKYTILKDYTGHSQIYVTEQVYMFFVALERIFRDNINASDHKCLLNDMISKTK